MSKINPTLLEKARKFSASIIDNALVNRFSVTEIALAIKPRNHKKFFKFLDKKEKDMFPWEEKFRKALEARGLEKEAINAEIVRTAEIFEIHGEDAGNMWIAAVAEEKWDVSTKDETPTEPEPEPKTEPKPELDTQSTIDPSTSVDVEPDTIPAPEVPEAAMTELDKAAPEISKLIRGLVSQVKGLSKALDASTKKVNILEDSQRMSIVNKYLDTLGVLGKNENVRGLVIKLANDAEGFKSLDTVTGMLREAYKALGRDVGLTPVDAEPKADPDLAIDELKAIVANGKAVDFDEAAAKNPQIAKRAGIGAMARA